jgi:hypothetical protein
MVLLDGNLAVEGNKVFALGGKITNTGLVEIPMEPPCGKSSRRSAAAFWAARSSEGPRPAAPSGGCIPAEHLDIKIDYDNLFPSLHDGSGGLIVMDEDNLAWWTSPSSSRLYGRRVLRKVRALPHRHQEAPRDPREDQRADTARWKTWTGWRSLPNTSRPTPFAARQTAPKPRPFHSSVFHRRIYCPRKGQKVSLRRK